MEYRQIRGTRILPNKWYLCLQDPPVAIVDQPMRGFETAGEAYDWLFAKFGEKAPTDLIPVKSERIL